MEGNPKFGRPTTHEEEDALILDRSEYLLDYISKEEERHEVDHLTGLKNRKFFEDQLTQSLEAIRRQVTEQRKSGEPLTRVSLIFVDIDNFKQVNDTLGHLAGDDVLKEIAKILTYAVRKSDVVARFGGDEFCILLPRAGEENATAVKNKIRGALDADPKLKNLGITASIGVSSVDESNVVDAEVLIGRADASMYEDKKRDKH